MRARKPCVRMRRLFRGRYVGLPMHKLRNQNEPTAAVLMRYPVLIKEKNPKLIQQMELLQGVRLKERAGHPSGVFDFSTCLEYFRGLGYPHFA